MDAGPRSTNFPVLAGRYELEALVGVGTTARVFRARDRHTDGPVAIKLLRPEFASFRDLVARFLREARAANLVRHPNVVAVRDCGEDDRGVPFLVQEFLEGRDLHEYLAAHGGRLGVAAGLDLLLPVIAAVGAAHDVGVVHRDLKPGNIFVVESARRPTPMLLDFGVSKIAAAPGTAQITAPGSALGTPVYMPPEQFRGARDADARADVWALGVILYQVLAGALPFAARTPAALLMEVCTGEPRPLEQAAPYVPPAVCRAVMRCLRRAPEERYPDATALLDVFERLIDGPGLRESGEMLAIEVTRRVAKAG